jgi:hypothetical protein
MNLIPQIFRRITPSMQAAAELAEAELALLHAHTGVEYAQSLVAYRSQQIARLRLYLSDSGKAASQPHRPSPLDDLYPVTEKSFVVALS